MVITRCGIGTTCLPNNQILVQFLAPHCIEEKEVIEKTELHPEFGGSGMLSIAIYQRQKKKEERVWKLRN
jgi:hypothetical protein